MAVYNCRQCGIERTSDQVAPQGGASGPAAKRFGTAVARGRRTRGKRVDADAAVRKSGIMYGGAARRRISQRSAANGRAAREIRAHELCGHWDGDGYVTAGCEVVVVSGTNKLKGDVAALHRSRGADQWRAHG